MINIIEANRVAFTGNYEKDKYLNTKFPEELELDLDYFNSVIRRSGIYLEKELMLINLINAGEIGEDINFNIEKIVKDFHVEKKTYNELMPNDKEIRDENENEIHLIREEMLYYYFFSGTDVDRDLLLKIVKGLEKIGYYDQE